MGRAKNFFLAITLAGAVYLAFSPCLRNGFVNWDDDCYITENALIRDLSPKGIGKIFSSFHEANYHPLALFSYAIEYRFCGLNPAAYHLDNLLLHLLNCLLAFWLFFLLTGNKAAAFITALLFGIHPLRAESVAWAAERRDVLYGFFSCSLLSFTYIIRSGRAPGFT